MDRKFLKELEVEGLEKGLPASVIDKIMAEYGTDFKAKDQEIETLKTEKEGLSRQLTEANEKIKGFADIDVDKLQKEVKDWEEKYNTDTENLKNELSKKEYDYKVNELVKDVKFSSNGAKRAFLEDLNKKELKFDEKGKLVGYDDFVKAYQETDPDAFVKEQSKEDNEGFKANTGDDHNKTNTEEDALINKIMGIK